MLFAQGGSNYSALGIGQINFNGNAAYQGLNGVSIAFPDQDAINPNNPALWTKATKTRLLTGYTFNQHLNENSEHTLFQNNGSISGLSALFSIDTGRGISASLGFVPYSRVKYYFSTPVNVEVDGETVEGSAFYQGSGGLNNAYIGTAFRVMDDLSVGISALYTFGSIQKLNSVEMIGDVSTFNTYVHRNDFFTGVGYQAGLYYEGIKNWGFGVYLEDHGTLDLDRDISYFTINPREGDTVVTSDDSYAMPFSFGLGTSYKTGKFIFGADFSMHNFSNLEYNKNSYTQFRDAMQFAVAMNSIGNDDYYAPLLDKISYKAGLAYKQQYFSVYGEDIDELSASIGFKIPLGDAGIIDAAVVFGKKGTTANSLVNEYFGRLAVDISIGETWFKPFRRRY